MRASSRLVAAKAREKLAKVALESPSDSEASESEGEVEVVAKKTDSMTAKEEHYWGLGCKFVVGVDEAGRAWEHEDLKLINDSKKLNELQRERLFEVLTNPSHAQHVRFAVATISPRQIDEMNILRASLFGMDQVVNELKLRGECDAVLIDGPYCSPQAKTEFKHIEAIKGGDAKVRSIAAASIIAKVTRDRLMIDYHNTYPEYGFDKHKGYPVKFHVAQLKQIGPCPIHRQSYAPVRNATIHHTQEAIIKKTDK
ncbi:hypothetical protein BASA81_001051 [Batrachochytrium salamandrivorans]|nr:hypothetical protein BASA81_001051 [Batrachochytrium salamandrivorans]